MEPKVSVDIAYTSAELEGEAGTSSIIVGTDIPVTNNFG
jgi:hypothetical protein